MILAKMNNQWKKVEFLLFDEKGNELSYSQEVEDIISTVYYNSKKNVLKFYEDRQIDQEVIDRNPTKFKQFEDDAFDHLKTIKVKLFLTTTTLIFNNHECKYWIFKILYPHRCHKNNEETFYFLDVIVENYHARINNNHLFKGISIDDYYWLNGGIDQLGYYNLSRVKYSPCIIVDVWELNKYVEEQGMEEFNEDDLLIYFMYAGVCDHVYNGHKIALINYANRVIKNK